MDQTSGVWCQGHVASVRVIVYDAGTSL
eukprot:SAG11_NODE_24718_length_369_cov_0.759259_1_plen_27_part_10